MARAEVQTAEQCESQWHKTLCDSRWWKRLAVFILAMFAVVFGAVWAGVNTATASNTQTVHELRAETEREAERVRALERENAATRATLDLFRDESRQAFQRIERKLDSK
jgi:sensor domain CHASE-containing protein